MEGANKFNLIKRTLTLWNLGRFPNKFVGYFCVADMHYGDGNNSSPFQFWNITCSTVKLFMDSLRH